jgi:hypothetical protein
VEEHEHKIQSMRYRAIDLTTTARNYGSLAEAILNIPSEGPFHVQARADLADVARQRQEACSVSANVLRAEADRLEAQGFEG